MILKRHYPDFKDMLNAIPDHRQRHTYEVAEIIAAGLLIFVLKRTSRNHADQLAGMKFEGNYLKVFGMRLPIMDTVHNFIAKLSPTHLENLREMLIRRLMKAKVFEKWKFQGYYNLSFDGTGVHAFDEEPFEGCSYKETKNGIKWYVSVLEAKLVFANGFSLSLDTEWIINQNGKFDKQDCEQAAFKRLSEKIKACFPRLAILVTADALYCSQPIFQRLKEYGWKFIFTFKDENLKTLWRTIRVANTIDKERTLKRDKCGRWLLEKTSYLNGLCYKSEKLSYLEHLQYYQDGELISRHVHLSNLKVTDENVLAMSQQGRLRWKIENEGFNTQKNEGYALKHKYVRKSFVAMQNYYLLLQIGHMLNQLVELLNSFQKPFKASGRTIKSIMEDVIIVLKSDQMSLRILQRSYIETKQLRY